MKRQLTFVAMMCGLVGCGGTGAGGDNPEPQATVTVTADPATSDSGSEDGAALYATADDLLTAATAAGFTCNKERQVTSGTRSFDDVTCGDLYTPRATFFRLFDDTTAFRKEINLFERSARYDLRDGFVPTSILSDLNGQDGTFWFIGGSTDTLEPLQDSLGGELLDFAEVLDVEPRAEKPPASPLPVPTSFGDGTYLVGDDVQAGEYRNDGDTYNGQAPCVAFTSTKPNDLQSYISGSTSTGPGIIQLSVGQYVSATGCQTWTIDR